MYGIKTGPPPKAGEPLPDYSGIGSICPYGMYFDGIDGKTLTREAILDPAKSPCIDYKSSVPGCKTSILGQCVDTNVPLVPSVLPRIFMTWFELPAYIKEAGALDYIQLLFKFCVRSKITNSNGITGMCFPMVVWPDTKNMTWLLKGADTLVSNNTNRALYGSWVATEFIDKAFVSGISPGILLYTNFKDGPWAGSSSIVKGSQSVANGFYSTGPDGSGGDFLKLTNPLTGKFFTEPPYVGTGWTNPAVTDLRACGDGDDRCAVWIWGAVIHFVNNYILPNCKTDPVTVLQQLWFHMDKEGCSCGLPEQYIVWMESHIGVTFDLTAAYTGTTQPTYTAVQAKSEYNTRLFLATGLGSPGASATDNDGTVYNSISVPENYWYAGNQLPCGGDPGSYNYARTACTSLNPHRRFRGYPEAFYDYTAGPNGSDCCPNWLGDGKWRAEVAELTKEKYATAADLSGVDFVWPSFSIENLSLCDTDDPNCYSLYTKIKTDDKGEAIPFPKPSATSTVCANMMFGDNKPNIPPPQGTRACGVFDGFSYWTWKEMNDWLNTFAAKTGATNLIVYEASFIPYHWFVEMGLMDPNATNPLYATDEADTGTRILTAIPPPTVETSCKSNADCGPNSVCLDPSHKPVQPGKTETCLNVCRDAPTGIENIGVPGKDTVWIKYSGTAEDAGKVCATYFEDLQPLTGVVAPPGTGIMTYTPPAAMSVSCKTAFPGYSEAKLASDTKDIYSCDYHIS